MSVGKWAWVSTTEESTTAQFVGAGAIFDGYGASDCGWPSVGFFYQSVSGFDGFLVDLVEQFRGKQHQVVFDALQGVAGVVAPVAVSLYLSEGAVLVGPFMNAVVVGMQFEAQDAQHQDFPLLHAGPAAVGISRLTSLLFGQPLSATGRQYAFQEREDTLPKLRGGIDVLQS